MFHAKATSNRQARNDALRFPSINSMHMSRIIETHRLNLRPLSPDDVEAFYQLCIEAGVRRYLFDDEILPREQIESFLQTSTELFAAQNFGLWGVRLGDTGSLIGFCGYWFFHEPPECELLYAISARHWGNGYASEAAQAVIQYGFERLNFERIQASADAPNTASVRVMQKLGMTFLKRQISNGRDTVYYALMRDAFNAGD
ncbi:MAG: GNAT family N-acetyltransferase [Acidobacteriota bacterium]